MIVWIVEHRIRDLLKDTEEIVVMHVASTQEKAVAWCRRNLDADEKRPDRPWWYSITSETVDADELIEENHLQFVLWDGTVSDEQPIDGYDKMDSSLDHLYGGRRFPLGQVEKVVQEATGANLGAR